MVGGCEFALFTSAGAPDGSFTQLGFEVGDLHETVAALRRRGVRFEEYGQGPLRTQDGIATVHGNYPSKGKCEYGAWFRDSEGNTLGLAQSFQATPDVHHPGSSEPARPEETHCKSAIVGDA